MLTNQKIMCNLCNDGKSLIALSEPNRNFLAERVNDGKLDLAITYSRIAWETCSNLKKTLDTKSKLKYMLIGVKKKNNEKKRNNIGNNFNKIGSKMTTM